MQYRNALLGQLPERRYHPETTQNTGLAEIGSQIDLNIQGLNEEARLNLDNFSK